MKRVNPESIIPVMGVLGLGMLSLLILATLINPDESARVYCGGRGYAEAFKVEGQYWCRKSNGEMISMAALRAVATPSPITPEVQCASYGYTETILYEGNYWCRGPISTILLDDLVSR